MPYIYMCVIYAFLGHGNFLLDNYNMQPTQFSSLIPRNLMATYCSWMIYIATVFSNVLKLNAALSMVTCNYRHTYTNATRAEFAINVTIHLMQFHNAA